MDFQVITTDDEEFIVAHIEGFGLKNVRSDHPNYRMVENLMELTPEELEDEGAANVAALFDPAEAISKRFEDITERVSVRNGTIYFDGDPLNNALADLIVRLMEQDEDFEPFVLFLENLMQNPNEHSRKMAFDWIQKAGDGMSITETGYVVGFKGAEGDGNGGYQSTTGGHAIVNGIEHNGHIPYAVGDEVTMPRSEVTFDPKSSCSAGLHVGTRRYAGTYARGNGALLEVWINPRDIVSVPEHEHEKMRCCRFYIADTVESDTVVGPLRRQSDVYVAPTESPYDPDEFGDGEEFDEDIDGDFDEDFDEDTALAFGADEDEEDVEDEDFDHYEANEEPFVGSRVRQPLQTEFNAMQDRAKRRHRGFVTYASTVGGWSLASGDGAEASHWVIPDNS